MLGKARYIDEALTSLRLQSAGLHDQTLAYVLVRLMVAPQHGHGGILALKAREQEAGQREH